MPMGECQAPCQLEPTPTRSTPFVSPSVSLRVSASVQKSASAYTSLTVCLSLQIKALGDKVCDVEAMALFRTVTYTQAQALPKTLGNTWAM